MSILESLNSEIEELRQNLYSLIDKKGSLNDYEILIASIALNNAANRYNKIAMRRKKNL